MTTWKQLSRPLRAAIATPLCVLFATLLTAAAYHALQLDSAHHPTETIDFGSANWTGMLDPARVPYGYAAIPATYGDGVTDCRAVVQAAIDAMPAAGGTFVFPPGSYFIHGTVNVTKRIRWVGTNQGNAGQTVLAAGTDLGNSIITDNTAVSLFAISGGAQAGFPNVGNAGSFERLSFYCTAASPTAGAFLDFTNATGMSVSHCGFRGGWTDVNVANGYYWTMDHCVCQSSRWHSVVVDDVALEDNGDMAITESIFGGGGCATGAAAIHYQGGGGLKLLGDKINGPSSGGTSSYPGYTFGVDVSFSSSSGDIILANNSLENVVQNLVRIDVVNPGDGLRNITIHGGNCANCTGTAIAIGTQSPVPSDVSHGIAGVVVGGIEFQNCPTAVEIGQVNGGVIGSCTQDHDVTQAVQLDAASSHVVVARQAVVGGADAVITDSGTANVLPVNALAVDSSSGDVHTALPVAPAGSTASYNVQGNDGSHDFTVNFGASDAAYGNPFIEGGSGFLYCDAEHGMAMYLHGGQGVASFRVGFDGTQYFAVLENGSTSLDQGQIATSGAGDLNVANALTAGSVQLVNGLTGYNGQTLFDDYSNLTTTGTATIGGTVTAGAGVSLSGSDLVTGDGTHLYYTDSAGTMHTLTFSN